MAGCPPWLSPLMLAIAVCCLLVHCWGPRRARLFSIHGFKAQQGFEALLYAAEPEVPAHRGTCHRPDMSHDTRQGGQGGRTENTISIIETGDAGPQDSGVGGPMCSRGAGPTPKGSGGDYSTVKYINCVHKS
jgi:hypothetical protein